MATIALPPNRFSQLLETGEFSDWQITFTNDSGNREGPFKCHLLFLQMHLGYFQADLDRFSEGKTRESVLKVADPTIGRDFLRILYDDGSGVSVDHSKLVRLIRCADGLNCIDDVIARALEQLKTGADKESCLLLLQDLHNPSFLLQEDLFERVRDVIVARTATFLKELTGQALGCFVSRCWDPDVVCTTMRKILTQDDLPISDAERSTIVMRWLSDNWDQVADADSLSSLLELGELSETTVLPMLRVYRSKENVEQQTKCRVFFSEHFEELFEEADVSLLTVEDVRKILGHEGLYFGEYDHVFQFLMRFAEFCTTSDRDALLLKFVDAAKLSADLVGRFHWSRSLTPSVGLALLEERAKAEAGIEVPTKLQKARMLFDRSTLRSDKGNIRVTDDELTVTGVSEDEQGFCLAGTLRPSGQVTFSDVRGRDEYVYCGLVSDHFAETPDGAIHGKPHTFFVKKNGAWYWDDGSSPSSLEGYGQGGTVTFRWRPDGSDLAVEVITGGVVRVTRKIPGASKARPAVSTNSYDVHVKIT